MIDALCAAPYVGERALFAGVAGGAGDDALCAVPYAGGAGDARGAGGDALCAALYVWRVSSVIDALCAYLVSSGGESTGLIWHDDGRVGNCFALVTLIHCM